jgi:general stress protein 26
MQDKVLEFLKNKNPKLCVLTTASKNVKPQAALVGYAIKDDLTIVLSTRKGTRKYENLQDNNQVALVFGSGFSENNVQMDGIATIIEEGNEYKQTDEFFFSQNPEAAKFKNPDTIFIVVKPHWIRFIDHSLPSAKPEEMEL